VRQKPLRNNLNKAQRFPDVRGVKTAASKGNGFDALAKAALPWRCIASQNICRVAR
jgi:hypothetical protein